MSDRKPSPTALAVLALLYEEPMHPYRMQKLIKERHKDEVINVKQRASLYQAIRRLERDGLIRVREVAAEGNLPDRTIYELTPEGREAAVLWMREMLSKPVNEYPRFPAALAHLPLLSHGEVVQALKARARSLEKEKSRLERQMRGEGADLPRLFLLETEYLLAVIGAEVDWLNGVIRDLEQGAITWSADDLAALAEELSDRKS